MEDPLKNLPQELREKRKKTDFPDWTEPMRATLTEDRFSSRDWIFERKLDGERCLAFRKGGKVRLLSRNRKDLNNHYPELCEKLAAQNVERFIVDGEVVAFEGKVTSFSRLQGRMHVNDPEEAKRSGVAVYYYMFDLLYLDRFDLSELPLRSRKALLKKSFKFDDPLRFTGHRNREGEAFFERACSKGWEGIIAKKADAGYVNGRSKKWLKFKCVNRQELVVGGFTDPGGGRTGFGALLLGFYEGKRLVYAGKVGTGFDEQTLEDLAGRLAGIERKSSPFDTDAAEGEDVHFVTPRLVAEIEFTEWTGDNRLRHPRFVGLREDKTPEEVVKEKPGK